MTKHGHLVFLGLATVLALHGCAGADDVAADPSTGDTAEEATAACGPALAAAAVRASAEQDGNPASQAVDGNLATRWSALGRGVYVTLDLGAAKSLCGVSVAWYNGASRRNDFTVGVSSDGAQFTQVYAGTSSGTTSALEHYAVTAGGARYVRLTINGNTQNDWASVTEFRASGAATAPTTTTGFRHPGVLVSRGQLDFVKARIAAGAQPWRAAFDRARGSRLGTTSYVPHPRAVVECGSSNMPNNGCTEEVDDAMAAYTQALLWYHTGDASYAQRAIAIMNAWSGTITAHTNNNAPLQAAWAAEVWTRAGELIRHTYTGWASAEVQRFTTMLTGVYLPAVRNGWWGGNNWDLSMIEAAMNIAVFTDDRALFDRAVGLWRGSVPAYFYLASDGALPVRPRIGTFTDAQLLSLWRNPPRLVDGMAMETCRDLSHTAMGYAAAVNAAETARLQGVDLYAEQSQRLRTAMEFHATYMNGAAVPAWLCNGTLARGGEALTLSYEIGYNAYANRAGAALPQTRQWILLNRPTRAALHMVWETLTHADVGAAGVP